MAAKDIDSESAVVWNLIKGIIKFPFIFILLIFGKKQFEDLFKPFKEFLQALVQPRFSTAMIMINILVYIAMVIFGTDFFLNYVNYPTDMFTIRAYTLVTAGFIHANIYHLLGNMLFIFIFGRIVEKELGPGKTAVVYFSSMIIANIVSSLVNGFIFDSSIGGVGASGAIMGLVATAILLKPFSFIYEFLVPLPVILVGWLAIASDVSGILSGIDDGVGHFAHLGGFLSIFITMLLLNSEDKEHIKKGILINILTLALALAAYYLVLIS